MGYWCKGSTRVCRTLGIGSLPLYPETQQRRVVVELMGLMSPRRKPVAGSNPVAAKQLKEKMFILFMLVELVLFSACFYFGMLFGKASAEDEVEYEEEL